MCVKPQCYISRTQTRIVKDCKIASEVFLMKPMLRSVCLLLHSTILGPVKCLNQKKKLEKCSRFFFLLFFLYTVCVKQLVMSAAAM